MNKQLFVFSAPSGAGKTTITRHLLRKFPELSFSVSATTRPRRPNEMHGKDYFFLERSEFEKCIEQGDLIEYEEIFGNLYGTLKSEVARALAEGKRLLFDIDVMGAISLKRAFPEESILIFVAPPSVEELHARLTNRNTESPEELALRFERVVMELDKREDFDTVIVNDDLARALREAEELIQKFA